MFGSNIVEVSLPSIERSLKASFAVVQLVISAYVLIVISERETVPMRAEAHAKMPCKLSIAVPRSDGPTTSPVKI